MSSWGQVQVLILGFQGPSNVSGAPVSRLEARGLGVAAAGRRHRRRALVQLLWDWVWIQRSHPGTPLHCPAPLGGRVKLAALGLCRCTVDNKIAASSEGRKGSEVLKSPKKVGVSWSLQSRHLGEFLPRSCLLCHNSPGLLTHAGVRLVLLALW